MNRQSLEQAWREISTDLDDVLDLDGVAREAWLETLSTHDPDRARRVRTYMRDLEKLEQDNFLGEALPSILSAATSMAGRRLGSYTVDRAVGHGGMGTVWLAHRSDGRFEGEVAIKLLNTALLGSGGEERFLREGHLLGKLEHPHIARLLDSGVSDTGQPLLVLEYVRGNPITEYCNTERLDVRARIELFLNVLAAVSHAHSRLVIHRDLKPANIFVTAAGAVKLLDFGIAKLTDTDAAAVAAARDLTRIGGSPLTLTYASPEQIRGVDIGTASDVYSLGVLLYELLTGELPYRPKRDTLGALEEEILSAQPLAPSRAAISDSRAQERRTTSKKMRRLLQGDLDTIVLVALRKEQTARYATADAFAEDLKRYLRDEPILARGESSWYRAGKFLSRNKLPVLAAAAAAVAMMAALGIALWQAHVAREHAIQAQEISHFIESVFDDADPSGSGTGDVRAADLLIRGRTRVDEAAREYASLLPELESVFGANTHQITVDLYEYAMIEQRRGELHHAIELGQRAYVATQAGGGAQRGVASESMGLAMTSLLARDIPAAREWAARGRRIHEEIFGPNDAEALEFAAIAIYANGEAEHPLEAVAQLQPLADQLRAHGSAYLARASWFQGELLLRAGQYRQATDRLREAETLAVAHPDMSFQLPYIRAALGRALLELGQLDAAAVALQAALSGKEAPHTATPAQAEAHAGLALLSLARNDPRTALAQATTADDFWRDFDPDNPFRMQTTQLRSRAQRAVTMLAGQR